MKTGITSVKVAKNKLDPPHPPHTHTYSWVEYFYVNKSPGIYNFLLAMIKIKIQNKL